MQCGCHSRDRASAIKLVEQSKAAHVKHHSTLRIWPESDTSTEQSRVSLTVADAQSSDTVTLPTDSFRSR
jgi:hypothetical protein